MVKQNSDTNYREYFSGKKLYGDDFILEEIERWVFEEKNSYANLGAEDIRRYNYVYHELNYFNGFRYLKSKKQHNALSIGGAYGYELLPIINRIKNITIIEPSEKLRLIDLQGVPIKYVSPNITGLMPFQNNTFDLVTCFGTLHHIPHVTRSIKEIYRVTKHQSMVLVREPIISMGDWRHPRCELTKHERGIPIGIFDRIVRDTGFQIIKRNLCVFPLTARIGQILKKQTFNSKILTIIDKLLCATFSFNTKYHRRNFIEKIGPTSVFYVLRKNSDK